ncbi:sugar phosphate permease, putative [Babesia ovata]|uniref:Sugar phosphate permease, putative n=1 Tax=Babesia ovata TaxID=189622 RepID=A0A2H6KHD6_9APIC|nr:sugar phosphate permease, putative [Babesia ovata]GBE62405.1 sugar phosphate permease, putative [Babesia ovata]
MRREGDAKCDVAALGFGDLVRPPADAHLALGADGEREAGPRIRREFGDVGRHQLGVARVWVEEAQLLPRRADHQHRKEPFVGHARVIGVVGPREVTRLFGGALEDAERGV